MNRVSAAILLCLTAAVAGAAEGPRIDFDTDVVPVLTRAGCNAGSCHGAAAGRGELRLSLYGGDPAFDFRSIALELEGRRVNLSRPTDSLLLAKATETLSHGGGPRFDLDSLAARLLEQWIAEGAVRAEERSLVDFAVQPTRRVTESAKETIALRATARFNDGSKRDVTRWTVWTAEDASAVAIDPATDSARVLRSGRHVVIARYLDRVVPLVLIRPAPGDAVDLSDTPRANFIDDHISAQLETLRIPIAPPVDDAGFLRRAMLDFTGRLPSPAERQAFLDDPRDDKRARMIDDLLASEASVDYWTFKLAQLLRIRPQPQDREGARAYHAWLRQQVAADVPYDQLARTLITASGDSHTVGPANFFRTTSGPREQAEFVSELFLGSRLRCANCHNHPLDRWTQDDYHGLAAVFARVGQGRVIEVLDRGEVIHPRTGEAAPLRIPGEQFLSPEADGRQALADWLTDTGNPYFAKAIVNRLWKELLGRGLVEPADDLRATNPATHPELLDALTADFVAHGYHLRHTLRRIAMSATYARSADVCDDNRHDDRYYSHALVRPLAPEVLADALADVTGVAAQYGDEPPGTRAVTLFDPTVPSAELDLLGRCDRTDTCEGAPPAGGLPRMLHLFNGPLLNARLADPEGRLARQITDGQTPEQIVAELYLRALSREPSPAEQQQWQRELTAAATPAERRRILEDFVWALCTCREFVTNH